MRHYRQTKKLMNANSLFLISCSIRLYKIITDFKIELSTATVVEFRSESTVKIGILRWLIYCGKAKNVGKNYVLLT